MKKLGLALLALLLFGLILAGCDDGDNEDETGFTLKIEGLPYPPDTSDDNKTWGASLLNPNDLNTPIAIGMLNSDLIFVFYNPNTGPGLPVDITKPFSTPGNYSLGVAVADLLTYQEGDVYMYKSTVNFTADNKNVTLVWGEANFTKK